MINLRCISIVVLSCLVLAAPAAADELSLSSTSTYPAETVTATVSVLPHSEIRPGVMAVVRLTSGECSPEVKSVVPGAAEEHPLAQAGSYTLPLQASLYEAFGIYRVCEYYLTEDKGSQASSQLATTFAVVARPLPPPPVVTPPAPPASGITPPAFVVHVSVSKRAKAVAKCHRLFKHKKRKLAACLKKAKKIR